MIIILKVICLLLWLRGSSVSIIYCGCRKTEVSIGESGHYSSVHVRDSCFICEYYSIMGTIYIMYLTPSQLWRSRNPLLVYGTPTFGLWRSQGGWERTTYTRGSLVGHEEPISGSLFRWDVGISTKKYSLHGPIEGLPTYFLRLLISFYQSINPR